MKTVTQEKLYKTPTSQVAAVLCNEGICGSSSIDASSVYDREEFSDWEGGDSFIM